MRIIPTQSRGFFVVSSLLPLLKVKKGGREHELCYPLPGMKRMRPATSHLSIVTPVLDLMMGWVEGSRRSQVGFKLGQNGK